MVLLQAIVSCNFTGALKKEAVIVLSIQIGTYNESRRNHTTKQQSYLYRMLVLEGKAYFLMSFKQKSSKISG